MKKARRDARRAFELLLRPKEAGTQAAFFF
jgi:hypothetical protein